ncbi:hypothetical protein Dimus_013214 [Dionaea muscipula]
MGVNCWHETLRTPLNIIMMIAAHALTSSPKSGGPCVQLKSNQQLHLPASSSEQRGFMKLRAALSSEQHEGKQGTPSASSCNPSGIRAVISVVSSGGQWRTWQAAKRSRAVKRSTTVGEQRHPAAGSGSPPREHLHRERPMASWRATELGGWWNSLASCFMAASSQSPLASSITGAAVGEGRTARAQPCEQQEVLHPLLEVTQRATSPMRCNQQAWCGQSTPARPVIISAARSPRMTSEHPRRRQLCGQKRAPRPAGLGAARHAGNAGTIDGEHTDDPYRRGSRVAVGREKHDRPSRGKLLLRATSMVRAPRRRLRALLCAGNRLHQRAAAAGSTSSCKWRATCLQKKPIRAVG